MSLSISNIAKGITWDHLGRFYLELNQVKYELLIDYLNSANMESLERDIHQLEELEQIRRVGNKEIIEEYILTELEGFNDLDNGFSAHIGGAHDLSPSIQYNIQSDSISIIHPNFPSLGKFTLNSEELINISSQMLKILEIKRTLKFGED